VTLLLVLLGGAVGAVTRFLTDRALQSRVDAVLPWGTLAVNVAGSLLLGLLAGAGARLPGWVGPLVGVGLCGALTTYSTFGFETIRLAESGARGYALVNIVATLAAGLSAAALGFALTG
jgi:CrcB protein